MTTQYPFLTKSICQNDRIGLFEAFATAEKTSLVSLILLSVENSMNRVAFRVFTLENSMNRVAFRVFTLENCMNRVAFKVFTVENPTMSPQALQMSNTSGNYVCRLCGTKNNNVRKLRRFESTLRAYSSNSKKRLLA